MAGMETEVELIWAQYEPRTLVSDVIKAVVELTGVPAGELISRRRTQPLVVTRWLAFHLCREMSLASYPQIARAFGKDHTTVMHGCYMMEKMIQADEELRNRVNILRERVEKIRDERVAKIKAAA